jgi:flagellar basal body-associated protein FliL
MEARRTFVGAKSYRQLWIILAALLCAAMLAIGAAFITSGAGVSGAAKSPAVTHPAPGTVLNQDKGSAPSVNAGPHVRQTVF